MREKPKSHILQNISIQQPFIMKKRPQPAVNYQKGISLFPKTTLLKWLEQNKKFRIKIPAIVMINENNFPFIRSVFVGVEPTISEDEKIILDIQDTQMGISFETRIDMYHDKRTTYCPIWLEGYWDEEPIFSFGESKENIHPFTVSKVTPYTGEAQNNAAAFVWIAF